MLLPVVFWPRFRLPSAPMPTPTTVPRSAPLPVRAVVTMALVVRVVPATSRVWVGAVLPPMPTLPAPEKVRLKPARGTSVAAARALPPSFTSPLATLTPFEAVTVALEPAGPVGPAGPAGPTAPVVPCGPAGPTGPATPCTP